MPKLFVGETCRARAAPLHEVTLAASGRKAGAAKKGRGWASNKTRSSLCKASVLEQVIRLLYLSGFSTEDIPKSYRGAKHAIGSGVCFTRFDVPLNAFVEFTEWSV